MSRPPRISFPGALYHITSRGNRRTNIFADDKDHLVWLDTLATIVERFNVIVHAFCLMPNHYHLLIETPDANISQAMHYLNGSYARRYNKRHELAGHLTQGRYYPVLIENDAQLLEVARYISLNPVRAKLVLSPDAWRWSSHRSYCGHEAKPAWLTCSTILGHLGSSTKSPADAYADFVAAGMECANPIAQYRERTNELVARNGAIAPLEDFKKMHVEPAIAMACAFYDGGYGRAEIARCFAVSTRTVDRALAARRRLLTDELVSRFVPDPDVDRSSAVEAASSVGINAAK